MCVCVCECACLHVWVILVASSIMLCLNMRELFETRESCVRGSNSHTYTLSQAQTACLYIHNLRHTRTHGDAKMQYTPHTSLINKGQLAIIISIFNQSPVVLLCGLSFDNWLSPALSLSFSLSFISADAALTPPLLLHVTLLRSPYLRH